MSIATLPRNERASPRQRQHWRWSQSWENVLFLHWPVSDRLLLAHLPAELALDRWQDSAWVSIVAFRLAKVRLLSLPPVPLCTDFLEINVRTYVRYRGEPGIYFLQMYGSGRVAVAAARWLTPLPYRYAAMSCRLVARTWQWQCPGVFAGRFKLESISEAAGCGSLDEWLVERYVAFVPGAAGRLCRMEVAHAPWEIAPVACQISGAACVAKYSAETALAPALCHFSEGVESQVAPFERVGRQAIE